MIHVHVCISYTYRGSFDYEVMFDIMCPRSRVWSIKQTPIVTTQGLLWISSRLTAVWAATDKAVLSVPPPHLSRVWVVGGGRLFRNFDKQIKMIMIIGLALQNFSLSLAPESSFYFTMQLHKFFFKHILSKRLQIPDINHIKLVGSNLPSL